MTRRQKKGAEAREQAIWELSRKNPKNLWFYYETRKGAGFDSSETGRKSLAKEVRR
jgi:hypothetical protein